MRRKKGGKGERWIGEKSEKTEEEGGREGERKQGGGGEKR